ncbi:Bug family tripartite tricarboxylate transporter substrate binding protein [Achromobacter aloeverae]
MRSLFVTLLAAAALSSAATAAYAADPADSYPDKPIHLVVPYTTGGGNDTVARALAKSISVSLHANVIVENRPGANGVTAYEYVARADPDGYTLFMANTGSHAINPSLYKHLRYDPVKDFTPISEIAILPNVLVVSSKSNIHTLAELETYLRAHPESAMYGSAGVGSTQHLSGAMFSSALKIKMEHVPYKGTAPILTDLLGGRLLMSFANIVAVLPQIKNGDLVPLAVTSEQRVASLPDVPTVGETVKGFSAPVWFGLVSSKGVPQPIVAKLNEAVHQFVTNPEGKSQLAFIGAEPKWSTPADFAALIASDGRKWAKVVQESGATAE